MRTRIISALIMITAIYFILLHLPWYALAATTVILGYISLHEYQTMAQADRTWGQKLYLMLCLTPFLLVPIMQQMNYTLSMSTWVFLVFIGICFLHLRHPLPLEKSAARVGLDLLGVLYVGCTLPFVLQLRLLDVEQGWAWVVLSMLITFGGDTGGYFAGRAFGGKIFKGRKLAPQLSPNKTWEGYLGGLLLGGVGAYVAQQYFTVCSALNTFDCLFLGVVGVTLGVWGDLFESMLKRSAQVKDSGSLIPGHGGVLDRIDALLFVAPFVYIYITQWKPYLSTFFA